jgi:hypothetical protein
VDLLDENKSPKMPALALPANMVLQRRAAIKEAEKRVMADPGFNRPQHDAPQSINP